MFTIKCMCSLFSWSSQDSTFSPPDEAILPGVRWYLVVVGTCNPQTVGGAEYISRPHVCLLWGSVHLNLSPTFNWIVGENSTRQSLKAPWVSSVIAVRQKCHCNNLGILLGSTLCNNSDVNFWLQECLGLT